MTAAKDNSGGPRKRARVAVMEIAGLLLGFLLFSRLHAAAGKDIASATANALALQDIERTLHVDIERWANQWLTEHPGFIQLAVYYYRGYYVVLAGVLLWVFLRHADVYLKVRRTLTIMAALAPSGRAGNLPLGYHLITGERPGHHPAPAIILPGGRMRPTTTWRTARQTGHPI